MSAGSAEHFTEELRRATTALGGIAEVLDEARASQQEAVQTRKGLQALRAKVRLDLSAPLAAMANLRRDMRKARRSLRRPLLWRIRGLRLRLFWRVARVALLVLLLVGLLLFSVVWVARNQDWLIERFLPISGQLDPEASDTAATGPLGTDPAAPDPEGPDPAATDPAASAPVGPAQATPNPAGLDPAAAAPAVTSPTGSGPAASVPSDAAPAPLPPTGGGQP